MSITQEDIRNRLGSNSNVFVQIASRDDGSPEIAWGDTFFYAHSVNGERPKMPFTTIVVKDYEGFDTDSKLNRGGLFRLNMEIGKEKFEELFGFEPNELEQNRNRFDFASIDNLFPHPIYGPSGWISIINPSDASEKSTNSLLDLSLSRALKRVAV